MRKNIKIQKFQKLLAGAVLAAVLLLPVVSYAEPCTAPGIPPDCTPAAATDFKSLVNKIIENINYLMVLVVGLAVFVFIWGIFRYFVAGANEKKVEEARNVLIYGLLGIFIMLSVWGLVNILINTFGFTATTQPTIPRFTPES